METLKEKVIRFLKARQCLVSVDIKPKKTAIALRYFAKRNPKNAEVIIGAAAAYVSEHSAPPSILRTTFRLEPIITIDSKDIDLNTALRVLYGSSAEQKKKAYFAYLLATGTYESLKRLSQDQFFIEYFNDIVKLALKNGA